MKGTGWYRRAAVIAVAGCMAGTLILPYAQPLSVQAAEEGIQWEDVQKIVSRYYGEWDNQEYEGAITSRIPHTALLGNGDIGVTSYGSEGEKSFLISKGDFWNYNGTAITLGGVDVREKVDDSQEYADNLTSQITNVTASDYYEKFYPELSIQGYKKGMEGWTTNVGKGKWIAYEFEDPVTIGEWILVGDGESRGETQNNPKDFEVQVSTDDRVWSDEYNEETDSSLWTTVDTVEGNAAGTTLRSLDQTYEAKYVRIWVDKPVQDDNEADPRVRMGRFEFYAEQDPVTSIDGDRSGVYEGSTPGTGSNGPFSETMNLDTADVDTSIYFGDKEVDINTWTAEGKNLLIQEMTSRSEEDLDLEISTWVKNDNGQYPTDVTEKDGQIYVTRQTAKKDTGNEKSFVSAAPLTTYVVGADVEEQKANEAGASAEQYVTLPAGGTIYLVTAVGGGGQTYKASDMSLIGDDPVQEAEELGSAVKDADDIAGLCTEHDEWWQDFWTRSYIDLGTEDANLNKIQSYYYGSLYLLGSALREDGLASGLYGNWFTTDNPNWNADYHLNYNFIAAYYGLNSTNHSDLTLPAGQALLDYMEEGLSRGQSTSELREIVPDELEGLLIQPKIDAGLIDETDGIEGAALYPVGIGPFGITCDDNYHQEAMNAAYSAYPMMEYYDYTQDKSYLEEGLYDLLKACGAYYEAWLTKEDTEDGDYEYALYAAYNEGSFSKNPAVELATVKNLFSHLIEYSEILGRDEAKRDQWNEILAHLPEQPTAMASGGESLALAELETPKENGQWVADVSQWKPMASPIPGDGNAIPLDAVLPGNVYNHYSSPEDLELVTNTIQTFVDNGNPWGQINNFPRIFPEAVEAGYDINTIVNAFVGQLNGKLQKNLTIEDNNHGFEKAGSIETVNQMMLNSECGMIDIFPNWLSDKDAEYAGFAAKGGFTVSVGYDGTEQAVSHVEITSTLGNECKLVSPWGGSVTVTDESGSEVETTEGRIPYYEQYDADGVTEYREEGTLITFDTKEGETYTVTRIYSDDEITAAKEELGAMIDKAEEALESKTPDSDPYDEEANKALRDAVDAAAEVYNDTEASCKDMMAQTAALQAALDAFDIAYGQWERPLGDPVMSGENPRMGTFDGYDVIAWEKGTGRMEYPSGSIADVLEIPSGTVVSNLTIDVSYYYDQVAGNSWWHFNTYDENGESAPGVSNGKPHDDGFGDFPGDYKMVSLAIHSLSFTAPDKAALKEAIDLGGRYDLDKYVEEGKAEFTEALETAKEVYGNGNALQEEVTKAWQDLVDAISELRLKADKTNLEELLKAVDDAVAELQAAKDGLTEKSGSGSGDEGDEGDGGDHTGDTGDGSEGSGGQQGSGSDSGSQSGSAGSSSGKDAPKTGDAAAPFGLMAAAALAVSAAAAGTVAYRRKHR